MAQERPDARGFKLVLLVSYTTLANLSACKSDPAAHVDCGIIALQSLRDRQLSPPSATPRPLPATWASGA